MMDTPALGGPTSTGRGWRSAILLMGLLMGMTGCDFVAGLFTPAPTSERAQYLEALGEADLTDAPGAAMWIASADSAARNAERVTLPVQREGWFDPERPRAVALRLASPDARWLAVRARLAGAAPGRLFVDALRLPGDQDESPTVLATAADSAVAMAVRVREGDDVLLRLQPELQRGGVWTLEVTAQVEEPFDDATE